MERDVLQELQELGRFFWEMFPGAKASDVWRRQRDQIERNDKTAGGQPSPAGVDDPGDKEAETAVAK